MADENNRPGFGKRLGQIAWGGFTDTAGNYFNNIVSLKSEADTIKEQVIQDGKTVFDVFNRMKNGMKSPGKKIKDWFYSEGMGFDGFGTDDDFDAGFKLDSANDESSSGARNLDADSMEDIAKKQTGEAYKIATKQAEMGMANTAEIVSAINSRSAEVTASLNKINETIMGISKKLDNMTGIMAEQAKKDAKTTSIVGYDGDLSLSGIFSASRDYFKEDKLGGLDMAKMAIQGLSPKMLAGMGFNKLFQTELKVLGDQSIKDISEGLNKAIGDTIQTGLMSLVKNETFQKWFSIGNFKTREDFQNYATNQYNTKQAIFDGMTRMSIISIIPEYLKNIEAAITGGEAKSIDDKGHLTTRRENYFQNTIRDKSFSSITSGISGTKALTDLLNGKMGETNKYTNKEVQAILFAVKSGFMYCIASGEKTVNASAIVDPAEIAAKGPRCAYAIEYAAEVLSMSRGGSKEEWGRMINIILDGLGEDNLRAFAIDITTSLSKNREGAINFAMNSPHAAQAGTMSKGIMQGAVIDRILKLWDNPKAVSSEQQSVNKAEGRDQTNSNIKPVQPSSDNNVMNLISGQLESIHKILNRGLDVFVIGSFNRRAKAFNNDNDRIVLGSQHNADRSNASGNSQNTSNKNKPQRVTPTKVSNGSKSTQTSSTSSPSTVGMDSIDTSNLITETIQLSEINENMSTATMDSIDVPPIDVTIALDSNGNPTIVPVQQSSTPNIATPQTISNKIANATGSVKDVAKSTLSSITGNFKDTPGYALLSSLYDTSVFKNSAGAKGLADIGKNAVGSITGTIGSKLDAGEAKVNEIRGKANDKVSTFAEDQMANMYERIGSDGKAKIVGKAFDKISSLSSEAHDKAAESGKEDDATVAREDDNTMKMIQEIIASEGGDGTFTEDAKKRVRTLAAGLHNKKMKSQVTRYIIPSMKTAKDKETAKAHDGEKNKSVLGGSLKRIIKYSGMIFAPITKILGVGVALIAGIGKKITQLSMKLIKSGAKDVFYGAKSVGQSLFGSKKPGEESTGMIGRVVGAPARANKALSIMTNGKIGEGKILEALETKIANGFGKAIGWIATGAGKFKKVTDKLKGWGASIAGAVSNSFVGKAGRWIGGKVKSVFSVLGNNDLVKGFTSARREKKEAAAKAKAENLIKSVPTTKSEAELSSINSEMSKSNGFLGELLDVGKNIKILLEDNKVANNPEAEEKLEKERAEAEQEKKKEEDKAQEAAEEKNTFGSRVRRAGSALKGKGSSLLDIGKMLGGISSILGGIGKIVLGAITQLTGFKALMNMITNILSSSLKPLNKAFNKMIKVLRPTVQSLKRAISSIAKVVSDIATSLIEVLQPILEDVVGPIIEKLGPVLSDLCKIVADTVVPILNVLVGTLLAPLLIEVVGVISPILKTISGAIQIVMGLLSAIFGGIMAVVGAVTRNKDTSSKGMEMMKSGGQMVVSGLKDFGSGVIGTIGAVASIINPFDNKNDEEEVVEEAKPKREVDKSMVNSSLLEGSVGNGDVTTNITNNYNSSSTGQIGDIHNLYGSANSQMQYGGYMGMAKHGCGPTALADAMYRRTGQNISATALAGAMSRGGTYSSTKGTSAAGFMSASSAMGVGLRAGGVTNASLKRATPNNPVTLLGSGGGFGTKSGNNHYVNVIGNNGKGISYVSNPMTGRVEQRATSDLVAHSALGLYGSGDIPSDGTYTFPDALADAMAYLKNLAGSLLKMFTGPTAEEEVAAQLDAKKQEQGLDEAEKILGDDYGPYEEEARQLAYADYAQKHPKLDSESEEAYQKKQEAYFEANKLKFLARTKVFEEAQARGGNTWANLYSGVEGVNSATDTALEGGEWGSDFDTASGGEGFYGATKDVKMYNFGEFKHKETNITKGLSDESPVHDFFGYMSGNKGKATSDTGWEQWYGRRTNPDKNGRGKTGGSHDGIDITLNGGDTDKKPLYAITDGIVTNSEYQDGAGNLIRWTDNSGQYSHIYMHMTNKSSKKVGDHIKAGELLGYSGHSGGDYGAHIHYGIYKDPTSWGTDASINPMTYWKYKKGSKNGTGGLTLNGTNILGDSDEHDLVWKFATTPYEGGGLGFSKEGAAGLLSNSERETGTHAITAGGEFTEESRGTMYRRMKSGEVSPSSFFKGGALGHQGFGLFQWLNNNSGEGGKRELYESTGEDLEKTANWLGQMRHLRNSLYKGDQYYDVIVEAGKGNDANKFADYYLRNYELGYGHPWTGPYWDQSQYNDCYAVNENNIPQFLERYKDARIPAKVDDNGTFYYTNYGQANNAIGSGHEDKFGNITINSPGDAEYYYKHKDDLLSADDIVNGTTSSSTTSSSSLGNSSTIHINSQGDYEYYYGTNDKKSNTSNKTNNNTSNKYVSPYAAGTNGHITGPDELWYTMQSPLPQTLFADLQRKEYEKYHNDPKFYTDNPAYSVYDLSEKIYERTKSAPFKVSDNMRNEYKALMGYDLANFGSRYSSSATTSNKKKQNYDLLKSYGKNHNGKEVNMKKSNARIELITDASLNNKKYHAPRFGKGIHNSGYADVLYDKSLPSLTYWYGSGDYDDFDIESYVGSENDIPPINTSDSAFWDSMGYGSNANTGTVNYNIVRTSDPDADKRINALMRTTFEVKSKTIEAKLQELIEAVNASSSGGSDWASTYNGTQTSNTKLFNERIPSQVSKLAIG